MVVIRLREKIISDKQLEWILNKLSYYSRLRIFVELGAFCGLRMCEIVKLNLSNIRKDFKELYYIPEKQGITKEPRTVVVPNFLAEKLKWWIDKYLEQIQNSGGYFFSNRLKQYKNNSCRFYISAKEGQNMWGRWRKAVAKTKEGNFLSEPINKIICNSGRVFCHKMGFHVFRAYYVTDMISKIEKLKSEGKIEHRGDSLLLVSRLVGHKKYDTTYSYYRIAEKNKIHEALFDEVNKHSFFRTPFTDKFQLRLARFC